MKKLYNSPELTITSYEAESIMTASGLGVEKTQGTINKISKSWGQFE
jgi:hypothetical protein